MGESRFLLINLGVVILLLILFLRGNRKAKPSHLRMGPLKLPPRPDREKAERTLNCMFQYNGHSWDAHEVLGVPAGAPAESIQSGYESALRKATDEHSKAFVEAAYQALKQQGQA